MDYLLGTLNTRDNQWRLPGPLKGQMEVRIECPDGQLILQCKYNPNGKTFDYQLIQRKPLSNAGINRFVISGSVGSTDIDLSGD